MGFTQGLKVIYFTADAHFSHSNIIKYANRPYKNAEEMDEALISNWNRRVKESDTTYHLGDFFCYGKERGVEGTRSKPDDIEKRLNGKIIHILGNHDTNNKVKNSLYEAYIRIGGHNVMLIHNSSFYVREQVSLVLCGHVHKAWKYNMATNYHGSDVPIVNCGVDVWNYQPVTINEILKGLQQFVRKKVRKHE